MIGKWVDMVLSRLVDVMLSIPQLIFALIILGVFGSSIPVLIVTIAVLDSTRVFRLARALGMNLAVLEFVEAARLRGEGLWWVIRREILPNAAAPLISEFGLRFCFNFLFVAALSFLGLGVQPPYADWGGMVRDNAPAINFGLFAPLYPALAIATADGRRQSRGRLALVDRRAALRRAGRDVVRRDRSRARHPQCEGLTDER